jgi:hypothetical protein
MPGVGAPALIAAPEVLVYGGRFWRPQPVAIPIPTGTAAVRLFSQQYPTPFLLLVADEENTVPVAIGVRGVEKAAGTAGRSVIGFLEPGRSARIYTDAVEELFDAGALWAVHESAGTEVIHATIFARSRIIAQ